MIKNTTKTTHKMSTQSEQKIADLAFQIQFLLQMEMGSKLVAAIGFPNAKTNDEAVKEWVLSNYIYYFKYRKEEMVQKMSAGITETMFKYFAYESKRRIFQSSASIRCYIN